MKLKKHEEVVGANHHVEGIPLAFSSEKPGKQNYMKISEQILLIISVYFGLSSKGQEVHREIPSRFCIRKIQATSLK